MNYSDKYKDRKPEETIEVIENFFKKRKMHLRYQVLKNCFGAFGVGAKLIYENTIILRSNGKGTSEKFALASAYAEMYERFCAFKTVECTPLIAKKVADLNIVPRMFKDGKKESLEDLRMEDYVRKYFGNDFSVDEQRKILKCICNGTEETVIPFINIATGEKKYFSNEIVALMQGSNGLAAGNSLEEAFNQGMSELCEREFLSSFWISGINNFYLIPNENIKNVLLKEIIKKMENNFKEVYIFDCSLYSDTPVIMVYMIDKLSNRIFYSIGSFPIFDIALERCLTEINQNIGFSDDFNDWERQRPFKSLKENDRVNNKQSQSYSWFYCQPEDFKKKIVKVDTYSDIFLKNEANNKGIFDYWKKYAKSKNINVFYRDYSLCNEMWSIRVYSETYDDIYNKNKKNTTTKNIDFYAKYWGCNDALANAITQEYNPKLFLTNFRILSSLTENDFGMLMKIFLKGHWTLAIYSPNDTCGKLKQEIKKVLDGGNLQIEKMDPFMQNILYSASTLVRYLRTKEYSTEELLEVGELLNCKWNEEQIEHALSYEGFLEHCLYKPLWDLYHSLMFDDFVRSICLEDA